MARPRLRLRLRLRLRENIGMRIALISDAWVPQVNGVVRTLQATVAELRARGHQVDTFTPDQFRTVPCPGYPEIRLAMAPWREIGRRLDALAPHAIHIATEGPLGWAARRWCLRREQPFTTSFHTRFPDYLALRTGLAAERFWPVVRRFHAPAVAVLVATPRLADELAAHGLSRTRPWSRGVDLSAFGPDGPTLPLADGLPRPLLLSVGRLAVEKNLGAFLSLDRPGTKLVVGDGPARAGLEARYPDAVFTGTLTGAALASAYRAADALVFPSLTDTFGLVAVERSPAARRWPPCRRPDRPTSWRRPSIGSERWRPISTAPSTPHSPATRPTAWRRGGGTAGRRARTSSWPRSPRFAMHSRNRRRDSCHPPDARPR